MKSRKELMHIATKLRGYDCGIEEIFNSLEAVQREAMLQKEDMDNLISETRSILELAKIIIGLEAQLAASKKQEEILREGLDSIKDDYQWYCTYRQDDDQKHADQTVGDIQTTAIEALRKADEVK